MTCKHTYQIVEEIPQEDTPDLITREVCYFCGKERRHTYDRR